MTTTIEITEFRNARSMNAENTIIDVEINHPEYGWIPYLLTDFDPDNTIDNDNLMSLIGTNFTAYVAPTQEELDEIASEQKRAERDSILQTEVDPLVTNPLRWGELTEAKQAEWATYRTDLLNVPQQAGFPNTINWPTKPE